MAGMTLLKDALPSIVCSISVGAVAFLALGPVLDRSAEWIDDDAINFRDNSILNIPLSLASILGAILAPPAIGVYEPGALIAKQLVVAVLGLYPVAIKVATLALHVLNAALSAAYACSLFVALSGGPSARFDAFLAVCLVTAHPLRVEVVAWCSCMPYGLAASACLLAALLHLWALQEGPDEGRLCRWLERGSIMCVTYAVFCKAAALGIGPFLICLDAHVWIRRPELLPSKRVRSCVWWHVGRMLAVAVGAVFAALADSLQPLPSQPDRLQRSLRATYGVWFNIKMNLWPRGANNFYPPPATGMHWGDPSLAIPALLMVTATLLPPMLLWRQGLHHITPHLGWHRVLLAAWTWWLGFLVLLAPMLGLAGQHLTGSLAHNRFTYILAFLVFVPALQQVIVSARWRCGRVAVSVAAVGILIPLLQHTWEYAAAWNHGSTIGNRTVHVNPELKIHLANKAVLRALAFEEAAGRVEMAQKILGRVLQHQPQHPGAIRNLGRILATQGKAEEAHSVLKDYVELVSDGKAEWWLAKALRTLGSHSESEHHLQRALQLEPMHDEAKDREQMMVDSANTAFRWR